MNIELTKDGDALICLLYKVYLDRRALNMPKNQARNFGDVKDLHNLVCPTANIEDTGETCVELKKRRLYQR